MQTVAVLNMGAAGAHACLHNPMVLQFHETPAGDRCTRATLAQQPVTCQHLGGLYGEDNWLTPLTEVNDTQIKENSAQPFVHLDNDKPCSELNETVHIYGHSLPELMYN